MSHTSIDTGLSTVLLVSPKVFCCCVTFVLNMEIGSYDVTFQQHPSLTYLSIMVNHNVTYLTLKGYTTRFSLDITRFSLDITRFS